MPTITTLNKIAVKNQIQPVHVYREYCQHLFLSFLYAQKNSHHLLFKGGTALRLAFGSPRYSEDLDFTLTALSHAEVEDIMVAIMSEYEYMNLLPHIRESKETSGGYLADLTLHLENESVRISIQASRRKSESTRPDVVLIENAYTPSYTAYLLNEQELVSEKIQAAKERRKPRDFFDIYFLLRANKIMTEHIKELREIPAILETENINFRNELTDFLPRQMHALASDFKNVLVRELGRYGI